METAVHPRGNGGADRKVRGLVTRSFCGAAALVCAGAAVSSPRPSAVGRGRQGAGRRLSALPFPARPRPDVSLVSASASERAPAAGGRGRFSCTASPPRPRRRHQQQPWRSPSGRNTWIAGKRRAWPGAVGADDFFNTAF